MKKLKFKRYLNNDLINLMYSKYTYPLSLIFQLLTLSILSMSDSKSV